MSLSRKKLGHAGEDAACRYLKRQGYKILARNFECPAGELDVVCLDGDCIVFVEVKTRHHDETAEQGPRVKATQQRHAVKAARYWLAKHRDPECRCRFDAVAVVVSDSESPRIQHVVESFVPAAHGGARYG